MYQHPMQESNLVATIGLMGIGIAIGTAWLWTANPELIRSMLNGLGGGHWVALAVLIIAALFGVACLRQLLIICLQLMGAVVRLAVLIAAVAGGLYLWRSVGSGPVAASTSSDRWVVPAEMPAPAPPQISPDERRSELEAELRQIDRQSGKSWWQK